MNDAQKKSYAFSGDATAICGLVNLSKLEESNSVKSSKVLYRKIRIRVLDCRSGEELRRVPVHEVRIDDEVAVRFKTTSTTWDISKLFPLWSDSNAGGKWKHGRSLVPNFAKANNPKLKGKGIAAQIALEALGYKKGLRPFSDEFGSNGRKRIYEYLRDHSLPKSELPDPKPKKGQEWQPKEQWLDLVIKEYNTRCFRMAGFCLASLGYYPGAGDPLSDSVVDENDQFMDEKHVDRWTEDWIKVFHQWQRVDFNVQGNPWDWVKNEKWGKRLLEAQSPWVTDRNGDLHIPVPVDKFRKADGFTIELMFKEFPVVGEATEKQLQQEKAGVICRTKFSEPENGVHVPGINVPTNFSVAWVDTVQKNERDKPWGWRLGPCPSKSLKERSSFPEFRTSWKFSIPSLKSKPNKEELKKPYLQRLHDDTGCFSAFYRSTGHPEFVLFAMRWCQPVWDELKDPPKGLEARISEKTYVAPDRDGTTHMHLVTFGWDCAGSEPYGGKGYGFYEYPLAPTKWRGMGLPNPAHEGWDLYGRKPADGEDSKVFAIHGGKVTWHNWSAGNRVIRLKWPDPEKHSRIEYLHLADRKESAKGDVKAGQVIAVAGRTGNLGDPSEWPTHCHINVGGHYALFDTPDPANRICLPTEQTPLVLPCYCEVTKPTKDPALCNFGEVKIWFKNVQTRLLRKECWVVAELACPKMPATISLQDLGEPGNKQAKRRFQAQLRYMHEKLDNDKYSHPGDLDGVLGSIPDPGNLAGPTRTAVNNFKITEGLLPEMGPPSPEDAYGIDQPTLDRLNKLAKVKKVFQS